MNIVHGAMEIVIFWLAVWLVFECVGQIYDMFEKSAAQREFLTEPPFCAHCGGTCECEDWQNDYEDYDTQEIYPE